MEKVKDLYINMFMTSVMWSSLTIFGTRAVRLP
jgi:hypothetical protein